MRHNDAVSRSVDVQRTAVSIILRPGPLAHPEEQGTFNPKVPGSRPGRPTKSLFRSMSSTSGAQSVARSVANGLKSGSSSSQRARRIASAACMREGASK